MASRVVAGASVVIETKDALSSLTKLNTGLKEVTQSMAALTSINVPSFKNKFAISDKEVSNLRSITNMKFDNLKTIGNFKTPSEKRVGVINKLTKSLQGLRDISSLTFDESISKSLKKFIDDIPKLDKERVSQVNSISSIINAIRRTISDTAAISKTTNLTTMSTSLKKFIDDLPVVNDKQVSALKTISGMIRLLSRVMLDGAGSKAFNGRRMKMMREQISKFVDDIPIVGKDKEKSIQTVASLIRLLSKTMSTGVKSLTFDSKSLTSLVGGLKTFVDNIPSVSPTKVKGLQALSSIITILSKTMISGDKALSFSTRNMTKISNKLKDFIQNIPTISKGKRDSIKNISAVIQALTSVMSAGVSVSTANLDTIGRSLTNFINDIPVMSPAKMTAISNTSTIINLLNRTLSKDNKFSVTKLREMSSALRAFTAELPTIPASSVESVKTLRTIIDSLNNVLSGKKFSTLPLTELGIALKNFISNMPILGEAQLSSASKVSSLLTSLKSVSAVEFKQTSSTALISFLNSLSGVLLLFNDIPKDIMQSVSRVVNALALITGMTSKGAGQFTEVISFLRELPTTLAPLTKYIDVLNALSRSFGGLIKILGGGSGSAKKASENTANGLRKLVSMMSLVTPVTRRATRSFRAFGSSLYGTNRGTILASRSIFNLFSSFSMVYLVRNATKAFVAFDKSLSRLNVVANLAAQPLQRMSLYIQDAAMKFGEMPAKLADAMESIYQLRFKGREAGSIFNAAVKLAIGSTAELNDVTKLTAKIIRAYGYNATQASHVTDVLFKTQELGSVKIAELARHMEKAFSSTAVLKVGFEEYAAILSTVTGKSVDVAKATTAMRATIVKLAQSKNAQLNTLLGGSSGKTLYEKGIGYVMNKIKDFAGGKPYKLFELGFNKRDAEIMLQMLNNSSLVDYNKILKQIKGSAGSTTSAVDKMMNTIDRQVKRLKASLQTLSDSVLMVFKDDIVATFKTLSAFTKNLVIWVRNNKEIVQTVGKVVGTLGLMLAAVTAISMQVGMLKFMVIEMLSAFGLLKVVGGAFMGIGSMLTILTPFIIKAITVVTGLVSAFMAAETAAAGFAAIGASLLPAAITAAITAIAGLVSAFIVASVTLATVSIIPGKGLVDKFKVIVKFVKDGALKISKNIGSIFKVALGFVINFKKNIISIFDWISNNFWDVLSFVFSSVWDLFLIGAKATIRTMVPLFRWAAATIGGLFLKFFLNAHVKGFQLIAHMWLTQLRSMGVISGNTYLKMSKGINKATAAVEKMVKPINDTIDLFLRTNNAMLNDSVGVIGKETRLELLDAAKVRALELKKILGTLKIDISGADALLNKLEKAKRKAKPKKLTPYEKWFMKEFGDKEKPELVKDQVASRRQGVDSIQRGTKEAMELYLRRDMGPKPEMVEAKKQTTLLEAMKKALNDSAEYQKALKKIAEENKKRHMNPPLNVGESFFETVVL